MHKLCPFCHKWMSTNIFQEHLDSHMQLLPDGQMKDHVTVPPGERFAGDIAKEPKWYVHPQCGGVTGMSDEIIRSYVTDPFLYNESSFCTGCNGYVSTGELFWQETNESLLASSYRRKAEFIQKNYLNPSDFVWDAHGPVRRKAALGSRGGGIWLGVVAVGGVVALLLLVGCIVMLGVYGARHHAAPRAQQAFPAVNAFPASGFPQNNQLDKLIRDQNKQMDELRKHNDEVFKRLRSEAAAPIVRPDPPSGFGSPSSFGPSSNSRLNRSLEDSRQRAAEARERAERRMQESRDRMKAARDRMKSFP